MWKRISLPYFLVGLLFVINVGVLIYTLASMLTQENKPDIIRQVKFKKTIKNSTNKAMHNVSIALNLPLNNFHHQQVIRIDDKDDSWHIDKSRNLHQGLKTIPVVPPYSQRDVWLSVSLGLWNHSNTTPNENGKWLEHNALIQSNAPEIKAIAKKVTESKEHEIAENSFKWIVNNIQLAGYQKKAMGALYALKEKKGDCTEMSLLLAALLRANNTPARVLEGYVVTQDKVIDVSDKHNWVEVWINEEWKVMDPTNKALFPKLSHYIVMKIVS